jgi:hypothetical protein
VDLDKYKELTGITVAPSNEAKVNATIRRTKAQLEAMLGFTLKPKNLYTEKGKVQFEGYLPNEDLAVLLPPSEQEGIYKLFPYNETDKFFHVDPYENMYSVKLVLPLNDGEFITVTELDNVARRYGRDGIGKYIEKHNEWFTWAWYSTWRVRFTSSSNAGLMLAVEADWLSCFPDDILYLWADMITHYSDANMNLKSESVDGHSWSKASTDAPESLPASKELLTKYAGPNGSVVRNPVR